MGECMTAFHPSDHICRLVLSAAQPLLICATSIYVSSVGAKNGASGWVHVWERDHRGKGRRCGLF